MASDELSPFARPRRFYTGFALAVALIAVDCYLLVQNQAAGRHSSLMAVVLSIGLLLVWHRFHSPQPRVRQLGGYGIWILLLILVFTTITLAIQPPQPGAAPPGAEPRPAAAVDK